MQTRNSNIMCKWFECHSKLKLLVSARVCSSHFGEADYERDLANELLNLPVRKILRDEAVPTLNLAPENKNPRKRLTAQNRMALASKRARKETVASRREVVAALLQDHSAKTKDAEVQVNDKGD